MNAKLLARVLVGIGISVVFLWASTREVSLRDLLSALSHARYEYLLPAMLSVVGSFTVRALRWRWILHPIKPVSMRNAFSATMIGFMANNVLPMRAGEVLRAVAIGRTEKMSRSAAVATIALERVFDLVALLLVVLLGSRRHSLPAEIRGAMWVLWAGTLVTLIAATLLVRSSRGPGAWIEAAPGGKTRLGRRAARMMNAFQGGLGVLRDPKRTLGCLVLSAVVWGFFVLTYHFSLEAFRLGLSLDAPFLLLGVVSIGVMLPSAPGYIGTMQLFFTLALEPFGVDKTLALSASWFFWFAQYTPVTAIGLAYFARENMTLRSALATKGDEERASVPR
jgi:uncharacterized protein (TIRG00374 family)